MQTFLPYADFGHTAHVLDDRRLWKQLVEAKQLLQGQFPNHPIAKAWEGYHQALCVYLLRLLEEWEEVRDGNGGDAMREFVDSLGLILDPPVEMPPWLGNPKLHSNHRARLLEKKHEHYWYFGWEEQPLDYNLYPVLVDGQWKLCKYFPGGGGKMLID